MDVKGVSSQGLSELFKGKTQDLATTKKEESPSSIIEKGIEVAKEQRKDTNSTEMLDKQVESMNKLLDASMTSLKFNVHEDLKRTYVQVVNRETDEVVKEIPPEKFLDMVASMLKHAGLIVDERI
ncbi:flagellar protein FlaG [Halalkalibacter nanhaiisediminis]|uniref:Flagellar protein FlaG n=1 Tax=Halalkalibacter nanhaiisediminis TaxID=688079 RepID=A0A562QUN9_9BACI|nr:flagellar protein FlaG [Halalkalibacter nanhaiisediminis]TWI59960.1 flagellar protein FlaG [Halalkalibacter nanhaiisediminis]